ncbi:MAG: alpha-E domain-containing protein [Gammaproteobacteria bacterium]|nr:alpha-E domain-containing protein [Gammaproteobacteria bacterium]
MLSRVAERVYWMSRNLERAENTARLVTVYANLLLDLPRTYQLGWETLIQITGCEEAFAKHYKRPDERNVIKFLLLDGDNPSSVLSSLAAARENARTTRDIFPAEAWEQLNELHLLAQGNTSAAGNRSQRHEYLSQLILGCQQFTGLIAGTLSRDAAYDFISVGRGIERADMTTRILDVGLQYPLEDEDRSWTSFYNVLWLNVLQSISGDQMYRRHVRNRVNGRDVAGFLLQDQRFPRSVSFCASELEKSLRQLPHGNDAVRNVGRLQRMLSTAKPKELNLQELHSYLDDLQTELGTLHNTLCMTWFTAAGT